jgi:two-component system, chemotaxis family, sensor kinase CheA
MNCPPDRDQETVDLFVEESLEALQRMERWLLDAEAGKAPKDLMSILFRDIHTIKGSAGFLAYERTRTLSHAAEDLLARLRDGTIKARPEHFSLLMSVGDALRRLMDAIKGSGEEDQTEIAPMVAQLRAAEAAGMAASQQPEKVSPPSPIPQMVLPHCIVPDTTLDTVEVSLQEMGMAEVTAPRAEVADGTVRVNVGVLDRLMNLIGELVLARNQTVQMIKTLGDGTVHTQAVCQRLSLVTSDLQEQIMKTRMQPVARVFEKIPRMARDLSNQTSKQVATHIDGTATEIDKALVEAIRDPVMHIVRNAIDHGLETTEERLLAGKSAVGQLRVSAAHEGGTVIIEIADDGRGMDPKGLRAHAVNKGLLNADAAARLSDRETLDLVFRPGFSTAKAVTDISGRGVGMDVVRTHVERAGGQVELESIVGRGTTIRLKMPLTLAIIPALLVKTGTQRFAIPQVNLLELVYLDEEQIRSAIEVVRGAAIYRLRGEILPLVNLSEVLKLLQRSAGGVNIVVVAVGTRRYGLVVDEIHDTEEIVIKPLQGALKRLPCYAGATVLGDGDVALILDVSGIASMCGIDISTRRPSEAPNAAGQGSGGPQPYVIFHAGNSVQCAVPLAMVARLEHLSSTTIEHVAGMEVVQYRNSIMPVVRPERLLAIGHSEPAQGEQPLIVFDFGNSIAMAVSHIVDIVEIDIGNVQRQDDGPYVLGKTVVMGATTVMIDVYSVVRELAPRFTQERRKSVQRPRLLLMDPSTAMRAALCGFLRAEGMDVTETGTGEAAMAVLKSHDPAHFDGIITDIEDGSDGNAGGLHLIRSARQYATDVPVFVWSFDTESERIQEAEQAGVAAAINKLQREELMRLLESHGVLRRRRQADRPGAIASSVAAQTRSAA